MARSTIWTRVLWFVGIWLASVLALAAVAYAIRWVIG